MQEEMLAPKLSRVNRLVWSPPVESIVVNEDDHAKLHRLTDVSDQNSSRQFHIGCGGMLTLMMAY